MSGWIKCSDRLPTDIEPVLAFGQSECNDTEHTFIGWTDGDKWYEINNGDYIDGGYGDDYEAVATHWQPLPAPPTEQPAIWRRHEPIHGGGHECRAIAGEG